MPKLSTTDQMPAWRSLYPFRSQYLTIGEHRYHYLDEGQGETLLLVHGNPTWSFYWRNLVRLLSQKYRLIVPDHLGCGLSDKPADFSYQLANHVANLQKLVETLDLRQITLVAHDWGGAIGMGAAVATPGRFARFVLMNTAAFRSDRIPLRIRVCRMPGFGRLAIQGLNAFAVAAIRMAVEHHDRMTPLVRAGLLAPYDTWSHRRATYEFVQDIPIKPAHPSYAKLQAIEAGLGQFRDYPVLLPWGMRDWCFTPRFLQRFLEFFPGAEVRHIADAGHYVVEDAYERLAPWIDDFVQRNPVDQGQVEAST